MKIKGISRTYKKSVGGWLDERFGDHWAQISTVNSLKLKSAVLDTARFTYGKVPPEIAFLSNQFEVPPQGLSDHKFIFGYEDAGSWVEGSINWDPALQEYVKRFPEQWKTVQKALGLIRSLGRHAGGIAIANTPIKNIVPTMDIAGFRCTAVPMGAVEYAGILKYDFLVINSLNDIQQAVKLVQDRSGKEIPEFKQLETGLVPKPRLLPNGDDFYDIWTTLPQDKQEVFEQIAKGKTTTIFQFDSHSAKKWLPYFNYKKKGRSYLIDSVEQMAIFTALDRPGPLDIVLENPDQPGQTHNALVEYTRRARGLKGSSDVLPVFEQLFPETHGPLIFQEQLTKAYRELTGCDGIEAEKFRSEVGKKQKEKILKRYQPFLERVTPKYGAVTAQKLWEDLGHWSSYGFCRSLDQATILVTCKGEAKKISEFVPGDMVYGVNDQGKMIETEVLALHDHGILDGFEVTFEDGYQIVCSKDHKFLTKLGMRPLWEIQNKGLGVYCEPQRLASAEKTKGQVPAGQTSDGLRVNTILGRDNLASSLLSSLYRSNAAEGDGSDSEVEWVHRPSSIVRRTCWSTRNWTTQKVLSDLRGSKEAEYPGKDEQTQSSTGTKSCFFKSGPKNVRSERSARKTNGKSPKMGCRTSGRMERKYWKRCRGKVSFGKRVKGFWNHNLEGCQNSLWGGSKTGRFCFSRSQDLGRSGRPLPFLFDKEGGAGYRFNASPGTRRNAKSRVSATGGRDLNQNRDEVFYGEQDEMGMEGSTFATAPLSETGGLVLRRIVRVRPVGQRRMYDLEVSHPKHNFLLPNGVVTSNSHAWSYALTGYVCGYLREFHGLEWWNAVLQNADKNEISTKFWPGCKHLVLLPDARYPNGKWEIRGSKILAPIDLLKGIGEQVGQHLAKHGPYEDVSHFCQQLQADREARSTTKTEVKQLKKGPKVTIKKTLGRTIVNSGAVYTMAVAGAMDGMFPPEVRTLAEKLAYYEQVQAVTTGEKLEPIKAKYANLTVYQEHLAKKLVLPMAPTHLGKMMLSARNPRIMESQGSPQIQFGGKWNRLMTIEQFQHFNTQDAGDSGYWAGLAGYVQSTKNWRYGEYKESEACKLILEVDGEFVELVKWPDRKTGKLDPRFSGHLEGALVVLLLNKWRNRPFNIHDIYVVENPFKPTTKDESE